MRRFAPFFLILFIMLINDPAVSLAQKKNNPAIHWSELALPAINEHTPQLGLAGAFAGFYKDVFLVAGGANFPQSMPWEGGTKKRYDDIYLWKQEAGSLKWIGIAGDKLVNPLAYGVSVSMPQGIFCAGGETDNGVISDKAFLVLPNPGKQNQFIILPSLPVALANAAATRIGDKVYIAGGETGKAASDFFGSIDLSQNKPAWTTLPPLPIPLSHAVAVTQQNEKGIECIYVIGGRSATGKGISELHGTVFCFDPSKQSWKEMASIRSGKKPIHLSASTGVAMGTDKIILFGGDSGDVFHRIESFNASIADEKNEQVKARLIADKKKLLTSHKGFNKEILIYDTHKNSWSSGGQLPFAAQVTTVAVKKGENVYIPSGEVRPGIRTPLIHIATIESLIHE